MVLRFRIFAVLASSLLVAAVALGTLAPADMSLAQALAALDAESYAGFAHWGHAHLGTGFWRAVLAPWLVRPLWLGPASLGLVFVGCALMCLGPPASQKRHRRS